LSSFKVDISHLSALSTAFSVLFVIDSFVLFYLYAVLRRNAKKAAGRIGEGGRAGKYRQLSRNIIRQNNTNKDELNTVGSRKGILLKR